MKIAIVDQADRPLWHDLLLIADEDPAMLARYEHAGTLWGGMLGAQRVACALVVSDAAGLELKNLAVAPEYQGQGLGSELLQAVLTASRGQAPAMRVGTGDAEAANLSFYTRNGFVRSGMRRDFYAQYATPILVDGVPLRDMVLLTYSFG